MNLSLADTIYLIEENLREFWVNCARSPRAECHIGPDMTILYTGIPYGFFNGVNSIQPPTERLDEWIESVLSFFRERHARWEWVVGPISDPPDLKDRLAAHGLAQLGCSYGMAVNLDADHAALPAVEGLELAAVDEGTLKTWAETVVHGFSAPVLVPSFVDQECALGARHPSYRRYLGLLNGQPVATSALLLGTRAAGIYCVSTLPSARRLGIGALITQVALDEARRMGYATAILQSSAMGRGVYARLGFQEYSTLDCYGFQE